MKSQRARVLCCLVGLAVLTVNPLMAQTPGEVTMETVVVTGTRTEEKVRRLPANVSVIDDDQIRNSNAKSVVDLLRSQEGIVVRDLLGNGKTAQVDLRGFGETGPYNTLVLVDGRRTNAIDLSGVDWSEIPIEQIERIEILRGTGSVLYGDNASGGVINIITKTPSQGFTSKGGALAGSYGRNREEISINGGKESVGAALFASYEATNGYRDNEQFRAGNVGGKILFDPTPLLSLNLSGSYHKDDYGLPGPLTQEEVTANRRATTAPFDNADTRDSYIRLGTDLDLGASGSILADFSYRERDTDTRWVSYSFSSDSETETWAVTPRYTWDGDLFHRKNSFIGGVDLYFARMDTTSLSGPLLTPSDQSKIDRDSYGAYFNDEISLFQNLIFFLGARREWVQYDLTQKDLTGFLGPLDDSVDDHADAYSAGLSFLYGSQSSLFARINRSFRFPLTDELIVYDFLDGQVRVNPDLRPQTGMHYELGVRHFFTKNIQANLTLFRAEIKDEIFFNAVTFTNSNHPETLHQGVEVGTKVELWSRMSLYGNYTYEKATFEKDPFEGKDIPAVPRHRANLGFQVHDLIPGLIFNANYTYVGSSYAISDQANQFHKLDSYYTIDTRLSYQWRWLKGFFGVNNLTDQEYSEYAVIGGYPETVNYYPAATRNWVAGLEMAF